MYPTDIKEFTASRLVAAIASALHTGAPLELRPLYDELDLKPTTIASYHAAAAAVHVLLAHEAGTEVGAEPAPVPLAARANGHAPRLAAPKAAAGEPAPARRKYTRRKVAKPSSSSSRKSKRTPTAAPLKCEVCGRPFRTQGRLTNHLRDRHGVAADQPQATATVPGAA